jgi:hypothetical protein
MLNKRRTHCFPVSVYSALSIRWGKLSSCEVPCEGMEVFPGLAQATNRELEQQLRQAQQLADATPERSRIALRDLQERADRCVLTQQIAQRCPAWHPLDMACSPLTILWVRLRAVPKSARAMLPTSASCPLSSPAFEGVPTPQQSLLNGCTTDLSASSSRAFKVVCRAEETSTQQALRLARLQSVLTYDVSFRQPCPGPLLPKVEPLR